MAELLWEAGQNSLRVHEFTYLCQDGIPDQADPGTVPEARLQAHQGILNLGYLMQRSCWTEFRIQLKDSEKRTIYLEYGFTQADVIQLFHTTDVLEWTNLGRAGNDVPTREWPVHYKAPTFEVTLQPGLNIIRVYQHSRDITAMDWKIWEPKAFQMATNWENILYGGFFAICLALSLYNLVIFAVSRDSLHFYYFLYLSSYGWLQMFVTGFTKLHFLPDLGPLLGRIGLSSISLGMFFTYLFVGKLLEVHRFPRFMGRLFWFAAFLSLGNVLLASLGPFEIAAQNCLIGSAFGSLLGFFYGAYAVRRKNPLAPIFMTAWTLLLVGTVIQVLAVSGFVDNNPLTRSANFIGATVEAIMISYALAFKMKRERMEETKRRQHAYSQLEKMVYPHQLAMMQAGHQLEETMPLATGHACVICVDMINSSKQNIGEVKQFLRCFFDECDAIMNRGYAGQGLQAYGFRIKEMGDGFLCSIGFPFVPPSHLGLREIALDMATDFVQKFEDVLAHYPLQSSVDSYLSIGIAEGPIEGFFTLSGIRSYELFGKGIVLATRYESLRKIFKIPGEGHVICLKSTVHEGLPAPYQKAFQRFPLERSQFIRDDEAVQDFYFRRIRRGLRLAQSA